MGDSHGPSPDGHMHHPYVFSALPPDFHIEGVDFANAGEGDPTSAHFSPLSMNMPTLSRPASMTSMGNFSLPPTTNSLSRVSSMTNMNVHMQHQMPQGYHHQQLPHHFNFGSASYLPTIGLYPSPYGVQPGQQQQQQGGQHQQQQQGGQQHHLSPGQMSMAALVHHPIVGQPDFRAHELLTTAFLLPGVGSTLHSGKPPKETKAKKPRGVGKKTGAGGPMSNSSIASPVARPAKAAKVSADKKVKDPDAPKPQRSRNPSSVFRGVSKCSKDGRWQARIRVKRQVTYLGRFVSEEDAARKYDEAARIHHGDKAVLNFPTEEDKQLGRKQATSATGDEDSD